MVVKHLFNLCPKQNHKIYTTSYKYAAFAAGLT